MKKVIFIATLGVALTLAAKPGGAGIPLPKNPPKQKQRRDAKVRNAPAPVKSPSKRAKQKRDIANRPPPVPNHF